MGTVNVTRELKAPVDKVWSYMVDVKKLREWRTDIQKFELLDEGELRVGFKVALEKYIEDKLKKFDCTITALEDKRKFGVLGDCKGFAKVDVLYELVPEGDGCTFHIRETVDVYSLKFMAPILDALFIKRGVRKALNGFLDNLQNIVEAK